MYSCVYVKVKLIRKSQALEVIRKYIWHRKVFISMYLVLRDMSREVEGQMDISNRTTVP